MQTCSPDYRGNTFLLYQENTILYKRSHIKRNEQCVALHLQVATMNDVW